MTLAGLNAWLERHPWLVVFGGGVVVVTPTALGAAFHHARATFVATTFTANALYIALRLFDVPTENRGSLFMRKR